MKKKCLFCHKMFEPPKYVEQTQMFCCHQHYVKYVIKHKKRAGKNNPMWGKKKTVEQIEKSASKIRGRINEKLRGKNNVNWKGGRVLNEKGYVKIHCPNHPTTKGKRNPYVLEHRLVMEKFLGKYLGKGEQVHHRNGIKDDNRLENLQLISAMPHFGKAKCPKCSYEFLIR